MRGVEIEKGMERILDVFSIFPEGGASLSGTLSHPALRVFKRRDERQSSRPKRTDFDRILARQSVPSHTLPWGKAEMPTYLASRYISLCLRKSGQEREAAIEGQRPPLQNHRHRQGSPRLLHHKPSKQAIARSSSVQHRRRGWTDRFCPDHGARSRSRRARTEQKPHAMQPSFYARGIHQLLRTHLLWQTRYTRGPTDGSLQQAVFPVEARVSYNHMDGNSPQPVENRTKALRAALSYLVRVDHFPCCVSPALEGLGWVQQGGAGGGSSECLRGCLA